MSHTPHTHNHKECLHKALAQAEQLCEERGVRLTPIRKRVLELIWGSHKAVKAYELLERLDSSDGAHAPPTIYRALDFLQAHGLVHKVESVNAFVGCSHPLSRHACQFFICDQCNEVTEDCDAAIMEQAQKNAERLNFMAVHYLLEVHGTCAACHGG